MDLAILNVMVGDWKGAGEIWEKFIVSKNRRYVKAATYNLALAYEMQGELDLAFEMAQKSYKQYFNKRALIYMFKLRKRIKYQKLIMKQFGY
jgi:hypothetical protein